MVDIQEYIKESNRIENVNEPQAHETAHEAWQELQSTDMLTEEVIKTAHKTLLDDRQPEIAGEYRDCYVRVGGDQPPAPNRVPTLIADLLKYTPETQLQALDWHIRFENIHPFADGNGRIGRLLYLWHTYEHQHQEPILWRPKDKEGYYNLFNTDGYTPITIE